MDEEQREILSFALVHLEAFSIALADRILKNEYESELFRQNDKVFLLKNSTLLGKLSEYIYPIMKDGLKEIYRIYEGVTLMKLELIQEQENKNDNQN